MVQAIRLGELSVDEQAEYLVKELCKGKGREKLPLTTKKAILMTVLKMIEGDIPRKESLGEWKALDLDLTPKLLQLKFGYYIDLCGVKFQPDSFRGYDIAAACFYQKDFQAPYDIFELQDRATAFSKMSLIYSIWGMRMFESMVTLLKDTYPILYEGKDTGKDDARKANDMLMVLCKEDGTRWEAAKNLTVMTAFSFLERRAIQLDNAKR